ncbi:MAG: CHAT domain-containing tetratricopeptide repeat protein, partial [Pseudonocardiaceae bacterium]
LGVLLGIRFGRMGAQTDLDTAIGFGREAVEATPTDHPDRARYLNTLGMVLRIRFERTGAQTDLDRAIEFCREAVEATPIDHPDRAGHLSSLGIALQIRFGRMGAQSDLDAAIGFGREAVEATPTGHPDRAGRLSSLGSALQARFGRMGAQSDLDTAIGFGREAVEATPTDHPDRAVMLSNLGMVLRIRFERTGAQTDLESAIEVGRQAVEAIPTDHPDRAMMLSNLGIALQTRFERTGVQTDLETAIEVGRQAVEATPTGHPDRAGHLNNLGIALQIRFQRTGVQTDLETAIEVGRQAVEAIPTDHPSRARHLNNLGIALRARFERTGAQTDVEAALSVFALAAGVGSAAPSSRIRAARSAARLAARSDLGQAAGLLEDAVRLLPEVTPRQLERGDRQHTIGRFAGLAADAAALALADPTTPEHQRPVRALQLLEAGRAVLLSQALQTRSDITDLRDHHPELAARFTGLRDLLDRPSPPFTPATTPPSHPGMDGPDNQPARDRHHLATDLATTLNQIRDLEGFASFALPPTTSELLAQAEHGPVVTFNISPYRSDALLLTTGGITCLELPGLAYATVIDQINAFHQALTTTTDPDPDADRIGAQARVRDILAWLWDVAAEPVLHALGHHHPPPPGTVWPRVWWATGGLLGLLPIHAAGHHTDPPDPQHRTVMDRVVSSYTPTITALRHARQHTTTQATADQTLIIAMPTTPGLSRQGRLPNVPREAALLQARLPQPVLFTEPEPEPEPESADETFNEVVVPSPEGRVPTKANVLAHLPACTIAHFACHGYSDPTDPSKSMLLLHDHHDDPLDIAALEPVNLDHARLAYLSACSTAITATTELLDEAIHLASAFQLAGFPHVIGTLWEINDAIAVTITDTFYSTLTHNGTLDTSQAAHALHHAVRAARAELPGAPSLWAAYLHAGA